MYKRTVWNFGVWPVDQMDQAMLGMPSREYYLTETDSEYKAAYLRYMINVAKLFGADEAAAVRDMEDVLHFEELLANVGLFFSPQQLFYSKRN